MLDTFHKNVDCTIDYLVTGLFTIAGPDSLCYQGLAPGRHTPGYPGASSPFEQQSLPRELDRQSEGNTVKAEGEAARAIRDHELYRRRFPSAAHTGRRSSSFRRGLLKPSRRTGLPPLTLPHVTDSPFQKPLEVTTSF